MAKKEASGISLLWKTEDWLAVWVGFLVIVLVLGGLAFKPPKFKWTTNKEFSSVLTEAAPLVSAIEKSADEKGEKALKADAAALSSAIAASDRKGVSEAAKKMEETTKGVKDEGLKKKAAKVAKDVREKREIFSRMFSPLIMLKLRCLSESPI